MKSSIEQFPDFYRFNFEFPYVESKKADSFSSCVVKFLRPICGERIDSPHPHLTPGHFRQCFWPMKDASEAGMSFLIEVEIIDPADATLFRMNIEALHASA